MSAAPETAPGLGLSPQGATEVLALLLAQVGAYGLACRFDGTAERIGTYRDVLDAVEDVALALGTTYAAVLEHLRRIEGRS
ncbi:hypothetical protein CLV92_12217 [Kineococcus xinjiangensis]|uniref:Uncharacterized protein n=1 Tax=Kineococcus xinjiangensis TaxID=512762 RepID=A0A2S6IC66_9ACTN|nr:hypothetical protein [Kineococcus xinjiangensis]PPK90842.1 hypothetical protein CLV92_12217 [Kineococcus xinjiangensis]